MAKEKYSQLSCKRHNDIQFSVTRKRIIVPERVEDFSLPASQRKTKKISLCVLSAFAVKTADPIRVTIQATPFRGSVQPEAQDVLLSFVPGPPYFLLGNKSKMIYILQKPNIFRSLRGKP
jgi:hypothetical protein